MDRNTIIDFHEKLTYERIHDANVHESDIKQIYREILKGISINYESYRQYYPDFLSSLEHNNEHSISYSVKLFFELYEALIESEDFSFFDLSVMDNNFNDNIVEKIFSIFEDSFKKENNIHRISEEYHDISSLSEIDKKEIVVFLITKIQTDAKQLNWSVELIENTMMCLVLLRQILISLNNVDLFYSATGSFFDRLASSEYNQAGRDIAEEIIISSYKDGISEWGYFNAFRLYSAIKNAHASLLYANLSMMCILQKKAPYCEKYTKEIIWQGMKLFRNIRLAPFITALYTEIPRNLCFKKYERRSLDHTYFSSLISDLTPSLLSDILDYLLKEKIFSKGVDDALPWLITLYNIRRIYPKADFTSNGFGYFIEVFESIVPPEIVKKYKDIIEGNSTAELKKHLKESLVKLDETRNSSDFICDNESAIVISSRLLASCIEKKDVSAFLMSMILKSDYSILFKSKEPKGIAPLTLPNIDVSKLNSIYEDEKNFLKTISLLQDTCLYWLGNSETKLFHLQLFNDIFSFPTQNHWSHNKYNQLILDDYFVNFSFSETVKDKSGVRIISPEEFKDEENEMITNLNISKLLIPDNTKDLYIIKDMDISQYPHNLFLNQKGSFIAKDIPVTNVLSTEWLCQVNTKRTLNKDYTKSIWIPTENEDWTLNYLYNKIEVCLNKNNFSIFHQQELYVPLSADVNIICSHGAKNISETQIVFQNGSPTYNLNSIIGNGKILIFFVCYSGSMKTEFFRNNITSMVKTFIAQGYEAVIAPFWALDATIPHYWLPEFMDSINRGETISKSTFNANKKVYDRYPTPAAWACLHLYGNPYLKIKLHNE